jgi:uncharacterized protein YyaL (SSP411 family)
MYDPTTGVLLRPLPAGRGRHPGLSGRLFIIYSGALILYETQFDLDLLQFAIRLAEKQSELFEDQETGAFYSSPGGDASLVLRMKEDYDGAEPSGNSLALMNLLRLSRDHQPRRLQAVRRSYARGLRPPRSARDRSRSPKCWRRCEFQLGAPSEIIIVGEKDAADMQELLRTRGRASFPTAWSCW